MENCNTVCWQVIETPPNCVYIHTYMFKKSPNNHKYLQLTNNNKYYLVFIIPNNNKYYFGICL